MFSWLGFGQKEKDEVVDENNIPAEQATAASEIIEESPTEIEPSSTEKTDTTATVVEENLSEPPILEATEPEAIVAKEAAPELLASNELPTPQVITIEESEVAEICLSEEISPEEIASEKSDLPEPAEPISDIAEVPKKEAKLGFFARLKQGLSKTRHNLGGGLFDLFRGKQIDDDLFEELETHLLMADIGVETTMKIIDSLTQSANRKQLKDAEALYDLLKIELKKVIEKADQPLKIPDSDGPFVMLMVGVNGVGKTTTIGKLAKQFQAEGKSVMLAAGDTFRAAAVEQLQVWGERNDIPVIAQHTGADSASVIFDAISAAKSRNIDIIIADTAGRLQNKAHLMEELKKVVRVMKKLDVNAPHEVMLTLDAGTGQNALSQTKLFDEAVGLTGLTLTKLDGTAKGGVVFAIADKHNIPIRYLGVGEGIDDLRPFNGNDFIDALFVKE